MENKWTRRLHLDIYELIPRLKLHNHHVWGTSNDCFPIFNWFSALDNVPFETKTRSRNNRKKRPFFDRWNEILAYEVCGHNILLNYNISSKEIKWIWILTRFAFVYGYSTYLYGFFLHTFCMSFERIHTTSSKLGQLI